MKFTLDSTLGMLLDNPQAKALLEKNFPGMTNNPLLLMAKGMTLNNILAMPQAAQFGLTKEKAEALLVEINKVA